MQIQKTRYWLCPSPGFADARGFSRELFLGNEGKTHFMHSQYFLLGCVTDLGPLGSPASFPPEI